MKTIKSKLKLLQETIDYYSVDPVNRRCINEHQGCYYSPKSINNSKSEGCAIGRLLSDKLKLTLDHGQYAGNWVKDDIIFNELPKNIKSYGQDFLSTLQSLHDDSTYWNLKSKGLSNEGLKKVERIKQLINSKTI